MGSRGFFAPATNKPASPSKATSMFGNFFTHDATNPRSAPSNISGKENLRSLLITFNHSHKSDEEKLRNLPLLLERIQSSLVGSNMVAILDSQLDVKGCLALISKAILINATPKDYTPLATLSYLTQCVDVMNIFSSTNGEQLWTILDSYKSANLLVTLSKYYSTMDVRNRGGCPEDANEGDFVIKYEALAASVTTGIKAYLKRDIPANALIVTHMIEISLRSLEKDERLGVWRRNSLRILEAHFKSKRFGVDQIKAFQEQSHFQRMVELFQEAVLKGESELGSILLSVLCNVMGSAQRVTTWFIAHFEGMNGHSMICTLLLQQIALEEQRGMTLESLLQLSALGSSNLLENVMEIEHDSPFQHSTFMMPIASEEFQLRNLKNIIFYQNFFLNKTYDGNELPIGSEELRHAVVEQFLQVIQLNPINYFILSGNSTSLFLMVESIDIVPSQLKLILLAILKHVAVVLLYVPFKELSLLFVHFHGSSTTDTTQHILKSFHMFIEQDHSWKGIFQELGLISTFGSLILFVERGEGEGLVLSECMRDTFDLCMSLLEDLLLTDTDVLLLRERSKGALVGLLSKAEYRSGALRVLKVVVMKGGLVEMKDCLYILNSTLDHEVINQLLNLLCDLDGFQDVFRELGGFESLYSCLSVHPLSVASWFQAILVLIKGNSISQEYLVSCNIRYEDAILAHLSQDNATSIFNAFLAVALEEPSIFEGVLPSKFEYLRSSTLLANLVNMMRIISLEGPTYDIQIESVLQDILWFVTSSTHNTVLLRTTLDAILRWIGQSDEREPISTILHSLSYTLTTLGMTEITLRYALSQPNREFFQSLVLHTLKICNGPSYFLFQPEHPSSSGCITLADFGRVNPASTGYTFMIWVKVVRLDELHDIPLLRIVDEGGLTTRLRVSISGRDKGVYLETVKGRVRMGGYQIDRGSWKHLAFVHHKPLIAASFVEFYVDGSLIVTEKCSYMGHPGSLGKLSTIIGSQESSECHYAFQVASTHLITENLLDASTIGIISSIGPNYSGNYQGSWAAYLIGNGKLQKQSLRMLEEEVRSPIFNQLATFALSPVKSGFSHSMDVPEDGICVSLSAQNDLICGSCVVNDSKTVRVANIKGSILQVRPIRVVDSLWTLGGSRLLLKLVSESGTTVELSRSLSILVESVNGSWRNLAEMERGDFYEMLGYLVKGKKGIVGVPSLAVLMALIGKDGEIFNPSALKYLVLDVEMWRFDREIQSYLIGVLAQLDARTLVKMGVLKRLLLILDLMILDKALFEDFFKLIKSLVRQDNVKMISNFLVTTLPRKDESAGTGYQESVRNYMLGAAMGIGFSARFLTLFLSPRLSSMTVVLALKLIHTLSVDKGSYIVMGRYLQTRYKDRDCYVILLAILFKCPIEDVIIVWDCYSDNIKGLDSAEDDEKRNVIKLKGGVCKEIIGVLIGIVHSSLSLANMKEDAVEDLVDRDIKRQHAEVVFRILTLLYIQGVKDSLLSEGIDGLISILTILLTDNSNERLKESVLELLMTITLESILESVRPVQAIEGFLNSISTPIRSQTITFLLTNTIKSLLLKLGRRPAYLSDSRSVQGIVRFAALLTEYVELLDWDLVMQVCLLSIDYKTVNKVVLHGLSNHLDVVQSLDRNAPVLFHSSNADLEYFKCVVHHLLLRYTESEHYKSLFGQLLVLKAFFFVKYLGNPEVFQSDTWLSYTSNEVLKAELLKSYQETTQVTLSRTKDIHQQHAVQTQHLMRRRKKKIDADQTLFTKLHERGIEVVETGWRVQGSIRQKFQGDYRVLMDALSDDWKAVLSVLEREVGGFEEERVGRWKLDFTEGRYRVRKKLRRDEGVKVVYMSKLEKVMEGVAVVAAVEPARAVEVLPAIQNVELVEELSSELEVEEGDGDEEEEVIEEDWEEVKLEENQNMKIQRLLQSGDGIIEIVNCARLVGLELIEGIALISHQNIYIVDNYFKRADGEIQDINEVEISERNIYHLIVIEPNLKPGNKPKESVGTSKERHSCRECSYGDIKEVHKRLYLFRNVALEMFLADGRNFFLTFWSVKSRDSVYNKLLSKSTLNVSDSVAGVSTPAGVFGGSPLADLTQKWLSREISNLAYLMHLNTLAGRSYNDLTQYPTFPWVLSNYESEELDLQDPANFRDLTLPMGGQGKSRAEQFEERYTTWDDNSIPPCHYGTHYSSSMIVCSFLIRVEPFTEQYLKLQGGHFDHADRIFHSIPQAYASASKLNTTDVRELIPEFFYLPNFLENQNKFNFGKKQTGECIDKVVLPKWAKGDPRLFVKLHRLALESEHVSTYLSSWIDLVFGYKQQGEEAAKALNVFHYLSYEGAVDIEMIKDPIEKQSTISIIHNFGQTPRQLFTKKHPKRTAVVDTVSRMDLNFHLLIQSSTFIRDLGATISDVQLSATSLSVIGPCKIYIPNNPQRYLEWGHFDNSLRIVNSDTLKRISVFESLHIGQITIATFADQTTLVTGGEDMTVSVWNYLHSKKPSLDLQACMRGHRGRIICLAASRSYSIIVSGSEDCSAIIWDLNRKEHIKTLKGHETSVKLVYINQNTGDILTADGRIVKLWDINGELTLSQNLALGDPITAILPFEGKFSDTFDTDLIFTGHQSGSIRIWKKSFASQDDETSPWYLRLSRTLQPHTSIASITMLQIAPSTRFLVSGDSLGKLSTWTLPDSGTEIHYVTGDCCAKCAGKLAVIGRKANCKCCGGLFCMNCVGLVAGIARCAECSTRICPEIVSGVKDKDWMIL